VGSAEALGGLVQDHRQHAVQILEHIAIPKTQQGPSVTFEEGCSLLVIGEGFEMLRTIEFQR